MTQPLSLYKVASTADNAMRGAGAGAIVGLLTTLFREKPTIKDALKHTLIGGGVGAATGVGLGALNKKETAPTASTAPDAKPKLGVGTAALSGIFPGLGPAVMGATQSADGDRIANAVKMGIPSYIAAMPGNNVMMSGMAKGKPSQAVLGGLLSMLGGSGAAAATADYINKSGSSIGDTLKNLASNVGQQYNNATSRIGNLAVNPLDPASGALAGGAGGAVLGGGIGLLKAILDSEDDGILGTIRKALQGAAVGGIGGAALGGGYSAMRRNNLMRPMQDKDPRQQAAVQSIISNYKVPIKSELNRIMGGDPNKYKPEIRKMNIDTAARYGLSPTVVNALENKSKNL